MFLFSLTFSLETSTIIIIYIIPTVCRPAHKSYVCILYVSSTGGFVHVYYILKEFKPHHCNVGI